MMVEILAKGGQPGFEDSYKLAYEHVKEFMVPVDGTRLNLPSIVAVSERLKGYLLEINQHLHLLFGDIKSAKKGI